MPFSVHNSIRPISGILVLLVFSSGSFADDAVRLQKEYTNEIQPLVKKYCGECHLGDAADAGLNFGKYNQLHEILNASKKWKKVVDHVQSGDMPPPDSNPLPLPDKKRLLAWLDQLFNQLDCTNINPGNITIRRMNRTEYRNAVKSLTGVDYVPASRFPGDDVGYGFDNIAEVLSLPPVLMEKYLDAAETIARKAVVDPASLQLDESWTGASFKPNRGRFSQNDGGSKMFFAEGVASRVITIPYSGKYELVVEAYGDQAGDENVKMDFLVNDKRRDRAEIKSTSRNPSQHKFTFTAKKGQIKLGLAFINDYYVPRAIGRQDRNLIVVGARLKGPAELPGNQSMLNIKNPGESRKDQENAAREFLRLFASRSFRRPVRVEELKRLTTLFSSALESESSFYEAIRIPIQAVLVSPHFLYKVELPTEAGKTRRLHDFELASSLSFFLWSDIPDMDLLRKASRHDLRDPKKYRQTVRQMLESPKSDALIENFVSQWLQLRALRDATPDPELFPGVDRQLMDDMVQETKLLVKDILKRDGSLFELLDAKYTYLNRRLADHYGIKARLTNKEFRRVNLLDQPRAGILTHASVLTVTSNPTRTSPVKRGKWVMENLLGEEPPPPLPDVVALDDQKNLSGNLRQRLEQHRSDPNCAACHHTMDALGFALENFDAVGRWREKDQWGKIDARSELPDGTQINGSDGLQKALSGPMRQQFVRCIAEKMLIYALGRGLEYFDQCALDQILQQVAKEDYRITALIIAVSESEPFQLRRGRALGPDN